MNQNKIIISGSKMDLTEALKNTVNEKVEKLLRHEAQIIRIHVELEYDVQKSKQGEFVAKGHIEIHGPPMIVSVASDDLYKSIDLMVDKLDRKIRRRARLDKVKRKAIHTVDIPAHLPKVVEV